MSEDKHLEEIAFSENTLPEEDDPLPKKRRTPINLLERRLKILSIGFLGLLLGCIAATVLIFITFGLVLDSQTRIMYVQKQIDELFSIVGTHRQK